MNKHCILIVDDEPNIRSSLTRIFQKEGYDTILAESADEALKYLKERSISVVLSDYIMPGRSGTAFLKEVKERYPSTIRVILSGRADMNAVMSAVDEGVVSHFFLKPWDNEVLRETVRHSIEMMEKESDRTHALYGDEAGEDLEELEKSFPHIVAVRETDDGAIIIDE